MNTTTSIPKTLFTGPDDEGIVNDLFVTDILKRMLKAEIIDDSISCTANSESLEDGPPSIAKVTLETSEVLKLLGMGTTVLLKDKSLLRLDEKCLPVLIVGDIHGQFIHLRSLFELFGGPSEVNFLFLGDYVDRGVQGVECVCLLVAMKLRYPRRVHLLRGNHEDANTTLSYGFQNECRQKFPKTDWMKVWRTFIDLFNALPLAALVNKKIFCMHGGLSPFMDKVDDIEKIERPLIIPPFGLATDLVWADPNSTPKRPGWSLSHRGASFLFDGTVVKDFCEKNGIDLIIRGHQITTDMLNTGYQFYPDCGRLLTIFSAPNYLNYHNAACVVSVSTSMRIRLTVFRSVEEEERERERIEAIRNGTDGKKLIAPSGTPSPLSSPLVVKKKDTKTPTDAPNVKTPLSPVLPVLPKVVQKKPITSNNERSEDADTSISEDSAELPDELTKEEKTKDEKTKNEKPVKKEGNDQNKNVKKKML